MGISASAPRRHATSDQSVLPEIVADGKAAAALAAAPSSSIDSTSSDDDSGVNAAASSPPPVEPAPLDHPSPEALARMCSAVATLIEGVGEDSGREGLFDTPKVREDERRESALI